MTLDAHRWAPGSRFAVHHVDRETHTAHTVRGVVLAVDELAELVHVRLDTGHETWLAEETLEPERAAA